MTTRQIDRLTERVSQLCELVATANPTLVQTVREVTAALVEPLRLAVVGRVKAGKSTLVNALIGEHVAPTNEAECTRIVTWYRYGAPRSASLVLLDGSTRSLPFDGGLPDDLGVPLDLVSHAIVNLPAAALRDFVLIDTPGLATSTEELEDATRRVTLGSDAIRHADALVYVFRSTERLDDVAFLEAFSAASGDDGKRSAGSIGVLSHADQFAGGAWASDDDTIDVARRVASEMSNRRRGELTQIVALAGRMAEQSSTGEVRERDAAVLARLAALSPEDRQDLQVAPFPIEGVDSRDLIRAVDVFHGYTLRYGGPTATGGAHALSEWMRERSGMVELRTALRARYVGRYPLLKASQAVAALRTAADGSRHRRELVDLIGEALLDDDLLPLSLLAAWEELRVMHPESIELREVEIMLDARNAYELLGLRPDQPEIEVAALALAAAARTQAAANVAAAPALANADRVLARAYIGIAQQWAGASG
ncbi:MAG: dynamin family protein [Pseudolysinimonas sp.]